MRGSYSFQFALCIDYVELVFYSIVRVPNPSPVSLIWSDNVFSFDPIDIAPSGIKETQPTWTRRFGVSQQRCFSMAGEFTFLRAIAGRDGETNSRPVQGEERAMSTWRGTLSHLTWTRRSAEAH
jgi:hypothetical protein